MRLGGFLCVLLAAAALLAGTASGSPSPVSAIPALPSHGQVVAERGHFLQLAEQAIRDAKAHWWNDKLGWYNEQLEFNFPPEPLVMLWSAFQLFEAVDAVAVADPTAANIAQAKWFANMAERYYNPALKPVGAYAYYMGKRDPNIPYFFDDNGWFGIAFMDAYQATHDRRYLVDALRAYRFLAVSGWNPDGGGFWWNTVHRYTTSEPLAAAVWIAARLYEATKVTSYLSKAEKWDAWANAHIWNASQGLYGRSPTDGTVMSYVEGLMAGANAELCKITGKQGYCARAEQVATNSLRAFSVNLHWAPQYDAVDLRGVLDLYAVDHSDAWYALAFHNAERAAANAGDARGLFQLGWDGQQVNLGKEVHPGQLGLHGATASLLAWVAAVPMPK
jgi:uncharacterized protein YyaL (SSP411 family)